MTSILAARQLTPGFRNPVFDGQRTFRAALDAFSQPGRAVEVAALLGTPPGLAPAGAAFLLTMLDFETSLWVQHRTEAVSCWVQFHCGAPLADAPIDAQFALISDASGMPDLAEFSLGALDYPDRSATIIVQVPRLLGGRRVRVSGPGIPAETHIEPAALRPDFWVQWQLNHAAFPCGVDVLFVCGSSFLALPRTTKVEV